MPQPRQRPTTTATPDPEPTTPSSSPSPNGDEARSASSPTGSSAGSDFISEPGPAFDPELGPAAPELDEPDPLEEPGWEERTIREYLELQGEVFHELAKWRLVGDDAEDVWLHTERDLGAIAPPLTRILNRYDLTRAAAVAGDEGLLIASLGRYAGRNLAKTRRLMAQARQAPPEPVSGAAADPGTGPEDDAEWQRTHAEPFAGPPALKPKGRG
jgi:hypothetical protein